MCTKFYVIAEPHAFLAGEVVKWLSLPRIPRSHLATIFVHFVEIFTAVKLKSGYVD